jgi:hypothetical protein
MSLLKKFMLSLSSFRGLINSVFSIFLAFYFWYWVVGYFPELRTPGTCIDYVIIYVLSLVIVFGVNNIILRFVPTWMFLPLLYFICHRFGLFTAIGLGLLFFETYSNLFSHKR